mgnify:FL=1
MKKSAKKALTILIVILLILIALSATLLIINRPKDRNDNTFVIVKIEAGSSTDDIARALHKKGVISSVSKYKLVSKLWRYDGKYKAGSFSVSPSMRSSDIAQTISKGVSSTKNFTIPEGYTLEQIAKKLDKEGIVNKDKFLDVARHGDFSKFSFLKGAQSGDNHLEGYLFPDTYAVDLDADETQIITTMLNQYDKVFTKKYRERAKELNLTENQIIIIASLIERESQYDGDRAKIASVIYNRIKAGMPLQIDATIQYALGKTKENLSIDDTKIDSPFNTYTNKGLPPWPICSPGKESIKAALYPEDTDFLYYVVSEKLDGTHNFSKDYNQFLKDKDAYSKALAEKNK